MLVLQGRRDVMGSKGRADRVVEMIAGCLARPLTAKGLGEIE